MLTVEEALQLVLEHARPLAAVQTPLEQALGLVLAEDVASDVDSPPHDKSIVDGYALVAADLASGEAELEILEEIVAGDVPTRFVSRGQATRLMTGAPVPAGADAVVMVERTELSDNGHPQCVRVREANIKSGQNILRQGASVRCGEVVLSAGGQAPLRPAEIGLLAEVGRGEVLAVPRPRVAVLSTGNELVPISQTPGPGQIRNSNGPMLAALVAQSGAATMDLGIGRDDRDELRRLISRGLAADVLVLSGGVSAGVMDLVPAVLEERGVKRVFHKLRLKPGKPLWFGVLPQAGGPEKLVFGLPGNPVSTFVCFELFVRPALVRLAGRGDLANRKSSARLSRDFSHRGDRPTYHPSMLRSTDSGHVVEPLRWQGSADLRTLAAANALAIFPAGDRQFEAGEVVEVVGLGE